MKLTCLLPRREGLAFADGELFESSGMNGHSKVQRLDPSTGKVVEAIPLDGKYFGEGLTYVDSKLYVLTHKKKTGFIFDSKNFSIPPETFSFETTTGEGWGMTYDAARGELIVSDGSEYLHIWDPKDLSLIRKVKVKRMDGKNSRRINELEFWRGRVLANVWYKDIILVINPATGEVEKEYDFSQLWPQAERKSQGKGAEVFNGISVSHDPDLLYVTGKYWDRMFLVRLLH